MCLAPFCQLAPTARASPTSSQVRAEPTPGPPRRVARRPATPERVAAAAEPERVCVCLAAIEFVLGNLNGGTLQPDVRKSLLHEGAVAVAAVGDGWPSWE